MTPLPCKPIVVIGINPNTLEIIEVASNIASINDPNDPLTVKIVTTPKEYTAEACNKPFDSARN